MSILRQVEARALHPPPARGGWPCDAAADRGRRVRWPSSPCRSGWRCPCGAQLVVAPWRVGRHPAARRLRRAHRLRRALPAPSATAITGYRNAQGRLQLRWDAIVKRYARGWLLVDLACSPPLQLPLPWPSGWLPSYSMPRLVLAVHLPSRFRAAFKGTVPGRGCACRSSSSASFAVLLPAHCFGCVWFVFGHVSGFAPTVERPCCSRRRCSRPPPALWWGIGTLLGCTTTARLSVSSSTSSCSSSRRASSSTRRAAANSGTGAQFQRNSALALRRPPRHANSNAPPTSLGECWLVARALASPAPRRRNPSSARCRRPPAAELAGENQVARRRRRDGGGAVAALNGWPFGCLPCTLAAILA